MHLCVCVICSHAYVHLSMSSGLQGIRTASYVMSLSHSLSSLSFTLIPVIHTVAVPVAPSFPSRPALSSLLAKFHTTCPKQRRFTDYHPFDAKRITRAGGFAQTCRHTRTPTHTSAQQGMQCHAGCPCVSSSCRVFPVRLVGGGSGAWLRFIHRKRVREGKEQGELMVTVCSLSPGKTN